MIPTIYEYGLQLGTAGLQSLGVNKHEISRIKKQFRSSYYGLEEINTLTDKNE